MQDKIKTLHARYCSLSRMQVGLRYNRESSWVEFIRSGFTEADLELVLKYLVHQVECGERQPQCLKFSNVIEQLDRFEEELALLRSQIKVGEPRLSILDLERVIKAKEDESESLAFQHANTDSFGLHWDNEGARDRYRRLRSEIRQVKQRIASMA